MSNNDDSYLVTVFEAINESLREIYLGTTALADDAIAGQFHRDCPAPAAHWRREDRVSVHVVERSLPQKDAARFITHYAARIESGGWKTLPLLDASPQPR